VGPVLEYSSRSGFEPRDARGIVPAVAGPKYVMMSPLYDRYGIDLGMAYSFKLLRRTVRDLGARIAGSRRRESRRIRYAHGLRTR